jgi:hypothetical protein
MLDREFKFAALRERNLSFVHATFFHGQEVAQTKALLIADNDIRFHVQTHNPVSENHPLFK